MDNTIEIKDSKKTYNIQGKKTIALAWVNPNIKKGEVFDILGPNGSGNTPLVRVIAAPL